MCYGSGCKYEDSQGECRKPRDRKCPDGMTEEELDDEQDAYEYAQEQAYEEKRERMFGV